MFREGLTLTVSALVMLQLLQIRSTFNLLVSEILPIGYSNEIACFSSLQYLLEDLGGRVIIIIITLRACARGKAIGLSICCHHSCRHENRQILRSRHLCVL